MSGRWGEATALPDDPSGSSGLCKAMDRGYRLRHRICSDLLPSLSGSGPHGAVLGTKSAADTSIRVYADNTLVIFLDRLCRTNN